MLARLSPLVRLTVHLLLIVPDLLRRVPACLLELLVAYFANPLPGGFQYVVSVALSRFRWIFCPLILSVSPAYWNVVLPAVDTSPLCLVSVLKRSTPLPAVGGFGLCCDSDWLPHPFTVGISHPLSLSSSIF